MSLPDLYYEITNFKAAVESSCTPSSSLDSQGVQMLEGACQNSVKQLRSMLRCHSVASTQSAAKQDSNSQAPKPQVIQEVLGSLMNQLDTIAEDLHTTLQDLDKPDLAPHSYMPSPHDIIAYAHKIRFTTFARAGTISQPPNPQPWQLHLSTLAAHGRAHSAALAAAAAAGGVQGLQGVSHHSALMLAQIEAATKQKQQQQQQQAPQAAPKAEVPAIKAEGAKAPPFPEGYMLEGGVVLPPDMAHPQPEPVAPVAAPAAPVVPVPVSNPALDLLLNADMEEVEDVSDSDDSDDDWD